MPKPYANPLRERFPESFFAAIPPSSGVYFMWSDAGEILYVGKAKCLRTRLRSYPRARPGKVGRNILKLLPRVVRISWECHSSEAEASERERELIRALVPRYNIADAWMEDYFFIGLRARKGNVLDFRLSDSAEKAAEYSLHGCYPKRRQAKEGYSALLRLLYACAMRTERFRFPSKLARPSPAYDFSIRFPPGQEWREVLSSFLHGKRSTLPRRIFEELLANTALPEYVRPGLQRDLLSLRAFGRACQRTKQRIQLPPSLVSHEELRRHLKDSIRAETRDF